MVAANVRLSVGQSVMRLTPVSSRLRKEDALRFRFDDEAIFYWQDKSRREVDFVIRRGRDRVDVLECKINPDKLDARPVKVFRDLYPQGENYLVSPAVKKPYRIRRGDLVFTACSTGDLPVPG